jgi:hypothetical protein
MFLILWYYVSYLFTVDSSTSMYVVNTKLILLVHKRVNNPSFYVPAAYVLQPKS